MTDTFPHVNFKMTTNVNIDGTLCRVTAEVNTWWKHPSNKEGHVSVTGEVKEVGSHGGEMFGCCHDEILQAFPWLAPIVRWHGSSEFSGPTYYVENGVYHLGIGRWSSDKSDEDNIRIFRSHANIGVVDGDEQKFAELLTKLSALRNEAKQLVKGDRANAVRRMRYHEKRNNDKSLDYTERRIAMQRMIHAKLYVEEIDKNAYGPKEQQARALVTEFLSQRQADMMQVMYADINKVVEQAIADGKQIKESVTVRSR